MFGFEDELKVAPKGVDKTHKCVPVPPPLRAERSHSGLTLPGICRDIDLLKCRSFAVVHTYAQHRRPPRVCLR